MVPRSAISARQPSGDLDSSCGADHCRAIGQAHHRSRLAATNLIPEPRTWPPPTFSEPGHRIAARALDTTARTVSRRPPLGVATRASNGPGQVIEGQTHDPPSGALENRSDAAMAGELFRPPQPSTDMRKARTSEIDPVVAQNRSESKPSRPRRVDESVFPHRLYWPVQRRTQDHAGRV